MISVSQVSKEFDGEEAVQDLTLTVKKGSIYGLLGSNGAGKTTLLKILAGIYRQDSGYVTIDERKVYENPDIQQRSLFLPDSLYFFPQTTIRQMANFYASTYERWNEERFQQLAHVFPIDMKRKVQRLSKGMQRQVAFWLAMSSMPDVLLLDEPIDGLDAVMRQKVKNLIVQDVADREMTVLISSHNLREVEDLCDHIGIMHHGKLLLERDLDDLKSDIHKVQVVLKEGEEDAFLEGLDLLYKERRGSILLCIARGEESVVVRHIRSFRPVVFDMLPLTLEEIFVYELGGHGYAVETLMDA